MGQPVLSVIQVFQMMLETETKNLSSKILLGHIMEKERCFINNRHILKNFEDLSMNILHTGNKSSGQRGFFKLFVILQYIFLCHNDV